MNEYFNNTGYDYKYRIKLRPAIIPRDTYDDVPCALLHRANPGAYSYAQVLN